MSREQVNSDVLIDTMRNKNWNICPASYMHFLPFTKINKQMFRLKNFTFYSLPTIYTEGTIRLHWLIISSFRIIVGKNDLRTEMHLIQSICSRKDENFRSLLQKMDYENNFDKWNLLVYCLNKFIILTIWWERHRKQFHKILILTFVNFFNFIQYKHYFVLSTMYFFDEKIQ